jgi:Concanavalin A-like lectin/glucanases superfamily
MATHATAHLITVLTGVTLMTAAIAAFPVLTAAQMPDTYLGISAQDPTGSPAIGLDGLVAAYDMETVTLDGRLQDFSGHQHHGFVFQSALVPGVFGLARQFTTLADIVDLPESPALALDGPLTIAFWARVDQLGLHQHVLACDDKFTLWLTEGNHLRFADTRGNGFESVDVVAAGTWASVVAVFTGTAGHLLTPENIAIFVNGQVLAGDIFGQWSPGPLPTTDGCYLGFESHHGDPLHQTLPFVGAIDELLIFSRALTLPEIAAHARPHP